MTSRPLPSPLYVICDTGACARGGWSPVDFSAACFDGGARLLQLRAKDAASGWFLDVAQAIVERGRQAGATVIVNDRADVALLSGAGGVHVGQEDLLPRDARRVVGEASLVGLSTHTPDQLERALGEPVSHVAIGPVFGTVTKDTGYQPLGLERVRQAARRLEGSGLPLVAIGGITLDTATEVLRHGAKAVAVIGDLVGPRPDLRVEEYLRRLSLAV